jgi:hypothetical protein
LLAASMATPLPLGPTAWPQAEVEADEQAEASADEQPVPGGDGSSATSGDVS